MRLLIVIVNYKSADLALDCLRSLEHEVRSIGNCRVSLTDCLSPDDSVARIRAGIDELGYGDWVDFRPLQRNGGFSYGNNAGIRPYLSRCAAGDEADSSAVAPSDRDPEYVLLLNPDTYIRAGALTTLLAHMDSHPKTGIAGTRLEFPDGTPQCSAFRFPTISSELVSGLQLGLLSRLLANRVVPMPIRDHSFEAGWVCGASLMIRRQVIDQIGLLDDGFFMYFEEVDFCLRAHRAGWRCDHVPASRVVHLVGMSSGLVTDAGIDRRRRPAHWFESRHRYFLKNHGALYTGLADFVYVAAFSLWRLRRLLTGRPDTDPERFLGDFLRHAALNLTGSRRLRAEP